MKEHLEPIYLALHTSIGTATVIHLAEIWLCHGPYVARDLAIKPGPVMDCNSLLYLGQVKAGCVACHWVKPI